MQDRNGVLSIFDNTYINYFISKKTYEDSILFESNSHHDCLEFILTLNPRFRFP